MGALRQNPKIVFSRRCRREQLKSLRSLSVKIVRTSQAVCWLPWVDKNNVARLTSVSNSEVIRRVIKPRFLPRSAMKGARYPVNMPAMKKLVTQGGLEL